MSLWGNTDANTYAPKFAVASGVGLSETGSQLYNTDTNVSGGLATVRVSGVNAEEQTTVSNAQGGHAGWVSVTNGTGGRTGRVMVETIVAMGSMSVDSDPVVTANDDVYFANT